MEDLKGRYADRYGSAPLVEVADEAPLPRDAAGRVEATIGGFSVSDRDPRRIGVVATLDNLLKGAATQALQNLELALFGEDRPVAPKEASRVAASSFSR